MSPKLERALKETLEIIDKRIQEYEKDGIEINPQVIEVDKGVLIHYFKGWNKYNDVAMNKGFNIENTKLFDVNMFFIPKNGTIECQNTNHYKTIVCLDGNIDVSIDGKSKNYDNLSAIDVDDNDYHVKAHRDTFVMLIEH